MFHVVFPVVQRHKVTAGFRVLSDMLCQLVVAGTRKTGTKPSSPDLAIKDMLGSNGQGLWGQDFLGIVNEVEHEAVCPFIIAAADKVCPHDYKGCVLYV